MFISLNKKIIYTISFFFLLSSVLFIYTFYLIYGSKIQEEQRSNIAKNHQFIEMLIQNINLSKELQEIANKYPSIKISNQTKEFISENKSDEKKLFEISQQKKQVEEMNKSYNERYKIIQESFKIISASAILLATSIIFLGFLLKKWVLEPIFKISQANNKISQGELSTRIEQNKAPIFNDEFDNLSKTYNYMLDTIESNIKEIKSKEKFLQDLIDGIPDGIRVIDKDHNIIIANKAYYKQIGKHSGCLSHKCYTSSQNIEHSCPENMFTCPLKEIIKNKKNKVQVIQQFCSNSSKHYAINAAPLFISSQQKYIVEAIRDLSGDINFSHQQKMSSLSFLASSVAHEMKNHLGSIRMIMERLIDKYYQNRPQEDEEVKHINMIYNQILSCIGVPERLLKLSRSQQSETIKINCQENLTEVIALLDFESKKKGIDIECKFPKNNIYIKGDEGDFKMLSMNIILNAINAMSAGGTLKVSINKKIKEQKAVIKFQDNGCGIEPQDLKRIFEPFYSHGKNSQKQGSGLGLSIVKSIVEKFGGLIEVESTINKGSCFTLTFPLAKN